MCLTIPAKIISINPDNTAIVEDYLNQKKTVIISAIPNVKKDDWILLNANLAIQIIDKNEAKELISLYKNE